MVLIHQNQEQVTYKKSFGQRAKAFLEKWVTAGDVTLRTKTYDAKVSSAEYLVSYGMQVHNIQS